MVFALSSSPVRSRWLRSAVLVCLAAHALACARSEMRVPSPVDAAPETDATIDAPAFDAASTDADPSDANHMDAVSTDAGDASVPDAADAGHDSATCDDGYDADSGECIASNEMAYGYPESLDWTTTDTLNSNLWRMVRVHIPVRSTFVGIGVAFRMPPSELNPGMRVALWTDQINVFDEPQPYSLLYRSRPGFAIEAPLSVVRSNDRNLTLEPGHYWLGVNVSNPVTISASSMTDVPYASRPASYASDPATSLGTLPVLPISFGWRYGLWAIVEPLP